MEFCNALFLKTEGLGKDKMRVRGTFIMESLTQKGKGEKRLEGRIIEWKS